MTLRPQSRKSGKQTDRQTNRIGENQESKNRQTDRQTDRLTHRQTETTKWPMGKERIKRVNTDRQKQGRGLDD